MSESIRCGTASPLAMIIEDDQDVRQVLASVLESNGYGLSIAVDGEEALELANTVGPDLIVLDLTLPKMNGLEVCRRLRDWFRGPILVLSGNGEEATIVSALDLGADDYLTKPFRTNELLARLRALTRRPAKGREELDSLDVGDLTIDLRGRCVRRNGDDVLLTKTEFEVVAMLAKNLDRVVSAQSILRSIWGSLHGDYVQTLRVHVGHIRKKIGDDASAPKYLLTAPGVGYRLKPPEASAAAAPAT